MNRRQLANKAGKIDAILSRVYGVKKQNGFADPTEELILTVLSQNTNDTNRDRAYKSLRRRFPHWDDIANARPSEIAAAIRVGGLANIKSKRIIRILRQIKARSAGYSLSFLKKMADDEVWSYLSEFDGVGPKTVSCVMLFSLGRGTMPVDTHVHRVGRRLGLIPDHFTAEQAHEWFADLSLPVDIYQLHLNMISHGRTLCRPARPKCGECNLKRYCSYYRNKTV